MACDPSSCDREGGSDCAEALVPGAKNILAVGAGKGGVGKSTVAVYVALELARRGQQVGLLDADIYGPSIPRMMGVADRRPDLADGKLQTIDASGVRLMSIGFLVDPNQAVAWRGPLVHKALQQLLADVDWGDLDTLVVDLPPGTGDVHLSLSQLVPVTGAVVVSTPQQVALQDGIKAVTLYGQTGIEILGLVENMSYFACPGCGKETELFGRGTVERAAAEMGVPYLGELPLNLSIRAAGDEGNPANVLDNDAAAAKDIAALVDRLQTQIDTRLVTKPPPQVVSVRKS
jgi:ATP-binding protein involved in chromosome partitioning